MSGISFLMGITFKDYPIEDQGDERHVLSGLDHDTFSVEKMQPLLHKHHLTLALHAQT